MNFLGRYFPHLILLLLIVFGIIELSISAFLTSMYNKHHNYLHVDVRDCVRYLLFASIWTVIFSAVDLGLYIHSGPGADFGQSLTLFVHFIVLTCSFWIFWLVGALAITVALDGGHDCTTIGHELPYCNLLNVLEGFAWVEWVIAILAPSVYVGPAICGSVRRWNRHTGAPSPITA